MPTLNKTIAQLNHLISACSEGEMIYRDCAQRTQSATHRFVFESLALQLAGLATQATEQVSEYGGRAHPQASVAGSLHCGWQQLKSSLVQINDSDLVDAGLKVEPLISNRFQALVDEDLDPLFRQQLIDLYEAWAIEQKQLCALVNG
ncbi:DUF2383 domain-containing protein [Pseudomonas sp. EL_65y_Pfl2_R95]|uniref:DUF2383 domain-containing protein n=1 Tax=Pseudomonas sp. EL_65y_Pfl2_R95 TaxID=3088698 RepID=UPI0030DCF868